MSGSCRPGQNHGATNPWMSGPAPRPPRSYQHPQKTAGLRLLTHIPLSHQGKSGCLPQARPSPKTQVLGAKRWAPPGSGPPVNIQEGRLSSAPQQWGRLLRTRSICAPQITCTSPDPSGTDAGSAAPLASATQDLCPQLLRPRPEKKKINSQRTRSQNGPTAPPSPGFPDPLYQGASGQRWASSPQARKVVQASRTKVRRRESTLPTIPRGGTTIPTMPCGTGTPPPPNLTRPFIRPPAPAFHPSAPPAPAVQVMTASQLGELPVWLSNNDPD